MGRRAILISLCLYFPSFLQWPCTACISSSTIALCFSKKFKGPGQSLGPGIFFFNFQRLLFLYFIYTIVVLVELNNQPAFLELSPSLPTSDDEEREAMRAGSLEP